MPPLEKCVRSRTQENIVVVMRRRSYTVAIILAYRSSDAAVTLDRPMTVAAAAADDRRLRPERISSPTIELGKRVTDGKARLASAADMGGRARACGVLSNR